MSAKKDTNLLDSARNALTGYLTVLLGIICFILALVAIAALTRFVVGIGLWGGASTVPAAAATTANAATSMVIGGGIA